MTQNNYSNSFRKILNYESVGSVICYGIATLVLFNFSRLDTGYLIFSGLFTISILTVLPTLGLRSLKRIKSLNLLTGSIKENLKTFTLQKKHLLLLQRIAIAASFLSLFFSPALAVKLLWNKTLHFGTLNPLQWTALSILVVLMAFFSRWGYRSYKKLTSNAEALLRDLEE